MSITVFFNNFVFKFLTLFFSTVLLLPSLSAGFNKELPETPNSFVPVVRFAVVSDIHIESSNTDEPNAQHFVDFFKDVYDYSDNSQYNKLDAIVVTGDMTGRGKDEQYETFNSIVESNIHEDTQLICMLGNHEFIDYRDYDPTIGYVKYKNYIDENVDRHVIINGYHFIAVSYSDDARTFTDKKQWLINELNIATSDTTDKPVFVFNHPHPFATVYGSINWGDLTLKNVLSKYSQVIDFSGHSHYAANDPRSIWQESFTAVGAGCLACQQTNLEYTTGGEDSTGESGTFWIVEADNNGNVRLRLYDVVCHQFFDDVDYYLSDIGNTSDRYYTWNNLKSLDTAPKFPDNAYISIDINEGGNITLSFPDACGYFATESYMISVKSDNKEVWKGTVNSNYVRAERNGMNVDLGVLANGTYDFSITPCSPYAKLGNSISKTIII